MVVFQGAGWLSRCARMRASLWQGEGEEPEGGLGVPVTWTRAGSVGEPSQATSVRSRAMAEKALVLIWTPLIRSPQTSAQLKLLKVHLL
jgi:hypothetical protein